MQYIGLANALKNHIWELKVRGFPIGQQPNYECIPNPNHHYWKSSVIELVAGIILQFFLVFLKQPNTDKEGYKHGI